MEPRDLCTYLQENDYPGRGILVGRSGDGKRVVAAYFIMGRSENSRNRIFELTVDGIRTAAHDPSKLTDPSLIIYHPVRSIRGKTIITNGDQTDTIRDFIRDGKTFREALETREFEPDAPNYTPRISALIQPSGSFSMAILKSDNGDPSRCIREYYDYDPAPGEGRFISTYAHDGNPLPSFPGEPILVTMPEGDPGRWYLQLWESLNADNRVSLYGWNCILESGDESDIIINGKDL